jgi:hypothetical protein
MSTIDFNTTQLTISRLLAYMSNGKMQVAEHQRNTTVWTDDQRSKFIDSVKQRMPFPTILLFEDNKQILWLEDGLQRITTMDMFAKDKFQDREGQKFSTWSDVERQKFEDYRAPVIIYTGATKEQQVEIFDRFQNGSPLKPGERLHSLSYTPLVTFTRKMFYDHVNEAGERVPGVFSERASRVWGPTKIGNADKRYDELLKLTALINGAAHGFEGPGCGISKKWIDLRTNLFTPINEEATIRVLDELFAIYELASINDTTLGRVVAKKIQSAQRDIGNFTGPIVYSLRTYHTEWANLRIGWLDALKEYRSDASYLKSEIHRGLSTARSWNKKRWKNAYKNVFGDDSETGSCEDEEDDEDENSDE